jgi:hypothetical protein
LKNLLINLIALSTLLALPVSLLMCVDHRNLESKVTPSTLINALDLITDRPNGTVVVAMSLLLKRHNSAFSPCNFKSDRVSHLLIAHSDFALSSVRSCLNIPSLGTKMSFVNAKNASRSNKGETNIA